MFYYSVPIDVFSPNPFLCPLLEKSLEKLQQQIGGGGSGEKRDKKERKKRNTILADLRLFFFKGL